MTEGPIGINFTGNAAPPSDATASAIMAVAEAAKAWAQALERFAPSLQGTPGITNSTISGCHIEMGKPEAQVVEKIKRPRRRTRGKAK